MGDLLDREVFFDKLAADKQADKLARQLEQYYMPRHKSQILDQMNRLENTRFVWKKILSKYSMIIECDRINHADICVVTSKYSGCVLGLASSQATAGVRTEAPHRTEAASPGRLLHILTHTCLPTLSHISSLAFSSTHTSSQPFLACCISSLTLAYPHFHIFLALHS